MTKPITIELKGGATEEIQLTAKAKEKPKRAARPKTKAAPKTPTTGGDTNDAKLPAK